MRQLAIILLCLFANIVSAQTSFVYKRNIVTGELEVYQGQGGFPTGSPLYKIKRNVWGYLEIQNVQASQDPFTKKPDYSIYSFKGYSLPAKEIFETLETLNKRNEMDYMATQPSNNTSGYQKKAIELQDWFKKRSTVANAYFKVYKDNTSFPTKLKDGWYDVVNIFDASGLSAVNITTDYDYDYGICRIENNKVVEYLKNCNLFDLKISYVFQKAKIEVSFAVTACRASFRTLGSNTYQTIYFMDNILDSSKQIANPNLSYYSIFTSSRMNVFNPSYIVQIGRNLTDDNQFQTPGVPYIAYFDKANPETNDCKNSLITLGFKKTENPLDKFWIRITRVDDKKAWVIRDLSLIVGECKGNVLTE